MLSRNEFQAIDFHIETIHLLFKANSLKQISGLKHEFFFVFSKFTPFNVLLISFTYNNQFIKYFCLESPFFLSRRHSDAFKIFPTQSNRTKSIARWCYHLIKSHFSLRFFFSISKTVRRKTLHNNNNNKHIFIAEIRSKKKDRGNVHKYQSVQMHYQKGVERNWSCACKGDRWAKRT